MVLVIKFFHKTEKLLLVALYMILYKDKYRNGVIEKCYFHT